MISALVDLSVVAVVLPPVSATPVTAAMVGVALALVEGSFLFPPFLTYLPYIFFLFLFGGTLHSFLGGSLPLLASLLLCWPPPCSSMAPLVCCLLR